MYVTGVTFPVTCLPGYYRVTHAATATHVFLMENPASTRLVLRLEYVSLLREKPPCCTTVLCWTFLPYCSLWCTTVLVPRANHAVLLYDNGWKRRPQH